MKIKVLSLLLLVCITCNIQSFDKSLSNQQQQFSYFWQKSLDKKAKFIPKRMTDIEKELLASYIKKKINGAQGQNNIDLVEKYKRLDAVLSKLISDDLSTDSLKDEKIYTDYFNLVIAELESLGENTQLILQTTGLRQRLLEGKLEKAPWFVKEIAGLAWLFEQDAKQAALNKKRIDKGLQALRPSQSQWPKPKDKALYIISLVDQIERNYQRIDTEDLATIIETCEQYLISFLPDIPAVLKRITQEAINKLQKIKNIRSISQLKE
ncbi:hypothetical protein EKK58_02790 [Candidatus Dependentiae bacterium]|nr:MAG: hypothetical protein EKK58_02790 [Candidatus Dependentiae bacterium]